MALNYQQIREDTPAATTRIHLDNAGSALQPRVVFEAQLQHMQLESEIGGYEAQAAKTEEFEAVYSRLERLFGAKAGEVAILSSATSGWDRAFYSVPLKGIVFLLALMNIVPVPPLYGNVNKRMA